MEDFDSIYICLSLPLHLARISEFGFKFLLYDFKNVVINICKLNMNENMIKYKY